MNEITIKGDTPTTTVAMLLSLARPHFINVRPPANDTGPVTTPVTVPTESDRTETAPRIVGQLQAVEQPKDETTVAAEPVGRATRGRGKARAKDAKTLIVVKWPDNSEKTFEAVSEAIEGMADALDLCDSKADVEKFLNDNVAITEQASDATRDLLVSAANERIQDILKAEAGEGGEQVADDPLPASDNVGADTRKAAEQPDDLELPKFLDVKANKAAAAEATEKVPSIEHMRDVFLKFCEHNENGVKGGQQALIDAGSTKTPPNLSSIPEANRAKFVRDMRKVVTVEMVPEE